DPGRHRRPPATSASPRPRGRRSWRPSPGAGVPALARDRSRRV
ncbi:MAG: hypothetical protein AVDCRST_MAG49-20, partial [uncultured Thermomicrobiales bacterium]